MVVRDPERVRESNLSDSKQRYKRGLKVIVEKSERQGIRRLGYLEECLFPLYSCAKNREF